MNKLYIWGWWQGNNLGDNWIKKTLSRIFPKALFVDTSVTQFEKGSFVICGGGGLFIHDVIEPWNKPQKNISYGLLGIGAEFPHLSTRGRQLLAQAKFFFARDEYSLECMHLEDLSRSYDVTFTYPLRASCPNSIDCDKVFFVWRDGHELLNDEQFRQYIAPGPSLSDWKKVVGEHFKQVVEDDFQTHDDNIEERIGDCGFVISGRYHGIVAAIQKRLPFVAIDICPKIRALLSDVGLEEYCLKISQLDCLPERICRAKKERHSIAEKENAFCIQAERTLKAQIGIAKFEILKALHPLRVIHYGSYWMKKNDVVNTMADDLGEVCTLKKIDLRAYSRYSDRRIKKKVSTSNGCLCLLDHDRIIRDTEKFNADAIILNSGGLYLEDRTFHALKSRGITCVGISLSDPDVFPYNGRIYANKFDLFYTNSKYSFVNEYPQTGANVSLLPFAASVKHHYYMPEVKKEYDLVVVAHAREDRIQVIEKLKKICKVGTYGSGWKNSLGTVNGSEHVKAINSGRMYLSFARTVAGFDNVKVGLFEAMACKQVVITTYMEELQDYFDIGKEILCYKTEDELYSLVAYYLEHTEELEQIRRKGYDRFLKEHTYKKRWDGVLKQIYSKKQLL